MMETKVRGRLETGPIVLIKARIVPRSRFRPADM